MLSGTHAAVVRAEAIELARHDGLVAAAACPMCPENAVIRSVAAAQASPCSPGPPAWPQALARPASQRHASLPAGRLGRVRSSGGASSTSWAYRRTVCPCELQCDARHATQDDVGALRRERVDVGGRQVIDGL